MAEVNTPRLNGDTHVNLTVRDLQTSTDWYCHVLGFTAIRDAAPPGSGFWFRTLLHPTALASVVLGQADEPDPAPFDERRVGLHHLAYHVPEQSELEVWARHLDARAVPHSGVRELYAEAGYGIWLRDPDNIWLELYWLNTAFFLDRLRQRWRSERAPSIPRARR